MQMDELNLPNFSNITMARSAIERVCQAARKYPRVFREEKAVEVCEEAGIEIDFCSFENIPGVLIQNGEWARMAVPDNLSETQTVKVILHELGHYELHVTNRFSHIFHGHTHKVTGEEKEADLFAFCLAADHIREAVRWNFIDYGNQ